MGRRSPGRRRPATRPRAGGPRGGRAARRVRTSAATWSAHSSMLGQPAQGAEAHVDDVERPRRRGRPVASATGAHTNSARSRRVRPARRGRGPLAIAAAEKSRPVTWAPASAQASVSLPKWHWRWTRSSPATSPRSADLPWSGTAPLVQPAVRRRRSREATWTGTAASHQARLALPRGHRPPRAPPAASATVSSRRCRRAGPPGPLRSGTSPGPRRRRRRRRRARRGSSRPARRRRPAGCWGPRRTRRSCGR